MQAKNVLIDSIISGNWHYGTSKEQLVILCHGFNSSSDNQTLTAIREQLNTKAHDTFTFNFSENRGGFDVEHQVDDIRKVVGHFTEYQEIILVAASFAALTAAIATIKLPMVSGLVTLNGFFGTADLGDTYRKPFKKFMIVSRFLPAYRHIRNYYRRELKPELITVPVLVIHSKADADVIDAQSKHFYESVTSSKRIIDLVTSDHGITKEADRNKVVSEIDSFLANL